MSKISPFEFAFECFEFTKVIKAFWYTNNIKSYTIKLQSKLIIGLLKVSDIQKMFDSPYDFLKT